MFNLYCIGKHHNYIAYANKNKVEYLEITKTDWFKEKEAQTTPAESLKLLRTTFGYTQQQLADKVGITKQQVSAMERGKEPIGRKMAHSLANALGTSYKNLFW